MTKILTRRKDYDNERCKWMPKLVFLYFLSICTMCFSCSREGCGILHVGVLVLVNCTVRVRTNADKGYRIIKMKFIHMSLLSIIQFSTGRNIYMSLSPETLCKDCYKRRHRCHSKIPKLRMV
jgi:hypothetical protein